MESTNVTSEEVTKSRVICEVPESDKIWFADYCRKAHISMSAMLAKIIAGLKEQNGKSIEA